MLPELDAKADTADNLSMEDRGVIGVPGAAHGSGVIFHASDAMRDMYDMGDAPSCHTCGAIMVRNGSCYRCMSCGSTSGCS
jgi:ribonucleoside-diphosphate reductase alpha chain